VRLVFNLWLALVDHGPDRLIFPTLKTYLIKTVCDFIEFENQASGFINDLFSTWDFLIEDIHVDSIDRYNWGESVNLSMYAEIAHERSTYSQASLSKDQQAYLDETAAELKILKRYELTKRI